MTNNTDRELHPSQDELEKLLDELIGTTYLDWDEKPYHEAKAKLKAYIASEVAKAYNKGYEQGRTVDKGDFSAAKQLGQIGGKSNHEL